MHADTSSHLVISYRGKNVLLTWRDWLRNSNHWTIGLVSNSTYIIWNPCSSMFSHEHYYIIQRTVRENKYLQASHLQICALHHEFDLWLVMEVNLLNSNIKYHHQKCSPCRINVYSNYISKQVDCQHNRKWNTQTAEQ